MTIGDRREAKQILRTALGEHVDPAMAELGFGRPANTLIYRRKVDGGHQRLMFDLEVHPRYAKDGVLLLPFAEVSFPPVIEIARRMLTGRSAELIDYTYRLGVESISPPSRRMLIIRDSQEADDVASSLASVARGRLGEVYGDFASVRGFVDSILSGKLPEVTQTPTEWVSVAAAQIHLGDPAGALQTLQEHVDITNPNLKEFTRAFDYARQEIERSNGEDKTDA